MWKKLKGIVSKRNQENYNIHRRETNKTNIVHSFNQFFIESTKEIVQSIEVRNPSTMNQSLPIDVRDKLTDFKLEDVDELRNLVLNLSNKDSPDEVNMCLLKKYFIEIAEPFINIVNSMLEVGIIPNK